MKPTNLHGDLSSFALADVVRDLARDRKTGTLTIQNNGILRHVQFESGKILSYGDNQGFSMEQWLTEKELLPPDRMEEASRRYRRAKKKTLGEILSDLGLMGIEEYTTYLREVVLEVLYEVFSFRCGTFEFHEGNLNGNHDGEIRALGIELTAKEVLAEAEQRMDEWERIRTEIPSENDVYLVPPANRKLLLEESEQEIIRDTVMLLDGTRTVRQVIAKLPYHRFDACIAVAQLIVEKKARLLDSAEVLQNEGSWENPEQEIACLRTILEREPDNRLILARLANRHEALGEQAESMTCYKLLAISYLDDGDLNQAEENLRKAIRLNPRDVQTWQKLWSVIRRQGNQKKVYSFGRQYVSHFKKLGLSEVARNQLLEMAKLFPDETEFRLELAEARFALGEQRTCIEGLFRLARRLVNEGKLGEAEIVFARILQYDRNNERARECYEQVRSGKTLQRLRRRQRVFRTAFLVLVIAGLSSFFAYDLFVRTQLMQATQTVVLDSLLEDQRYDEAIARIKEIQEKHPYSLTANFESQKLLEALREQREKLKSKKFGRKE